MRSAPGRVRDAILEILGNIPEGLPVRQIEERVVQAIGPTPRSSVRSYLRLNTPGIFVREQRGVYSVRPEVLADLQPNLELEVRSRRKPIEFGRSTLAHDDCFTWLEKREINSIHAVVTDPPYGLHEYTPEQQLKMRNGRGGVWRLPPSFDGHARSPLPRFTTLSDRQRRQLGQFFTLWGGLLLPRLVPGANVIVASNPLLSHILAGALEDAGLECRGSITRLVMTMRGGDRPKAAHEKYPDVSVMPRSMWEPWIVFRKPVEGRVQGQSSEVEDRRFPTPVRGQALWRCDQVGSDTQDRERPRTPSEPEAAGLPQASGPRSPAARGGYRSGIPSPAAGSTLAAAEAVGYRSIGIEKDCHYFDLAARAIPALRDFEPRDRS